MKGKQMKLSISRGNSKIGKTLNVSLPPIVTCRKNAPCAKDCYANNHAYRLYPGTRAAWDGNLEFYRTAPHVYFGEIHEAIRRSRTCKLFRWHVGGDIPDVDYLCSMITVAHANPKVSFLCFTKQYEIVANFAKTHIPRNLRIVLSMWPGLKVPKGLEHLPKAWMHDCKDPDKRIPKSAEACPGACEACGLCWGLGMGQSVYFDKH